MAERMGWRRRLLFGAVLAAVAVLSVELPLQLFYRFTAGDWLFRRAQPPIFEVDPTRCYRVKPDLDYVHRTNEFEIHVYTNAQSLRTDRARAPIAIEKPEDVYRVLFLGPSFTFGWGSDFEETYPARIAAALRVPGRRVELINAGTPGQSTELQLCWFAAEGRRFRPDLVVLTTYGLRVEPAPLACPQQPACPYIEDSYLYFAQPTLRRRAIAAMKNLGVVFYGFYVYNRLVPQHEEPRVGLGKELYNAPEEKSPDLARLVESYRGFQATVQRLAGAEVKVAFLHLPMSFQVHPGDRLRWRHIIDVDPSADTAATHVSLAALRAAGLAAIDPIDALMAAADRERQYFWIDIHLTPDGNRTVAEAALPVLQPLVLPEAKASPQGIDPTRSSNQAPEGGFSANRRSKPSSSTISTASSRAVASLLPGSAPAIR